MLKRSLAVFFLVPVLVLAIQPSPTVQGVVMTAEELAAVSSAEAPDNAAAEESKQDGNGFVRALKAPFMAIGRIFGGKKKKNAQNNVQRMSQDDARRFESTPARIVADARVTSKEASGDADRTIATTIDHFTHLNNGRDLLNAGDVDAAISELSTAVALEPKSGEAMNFLGIAYEAKGLRRKALELFKAAVEADKNSSDYLNNYGFLLFKNNDFDEATKYLKRAAKLSPNDPRIWNNLGLAQCKREKFDDAFRSFARVGGDFNGHMNVAAQLSSQGRAKDAIKHLEKAQALQPESVDVLAKLASLYEMTGRVSDAEATRRSIVALRTFADANK